ncbi:MAG: alpha/beta fold hydrolase [Betaproteobacteria bacterium]
MAVSSPATRHVVKHGDVQIEVLARGNGPRVVMFPSLGRGATDFDDIAARIAAAGYRVLCPQPRGIGASRGLLAGITLHDYASDVAAVIEDDGGEPSVIAGHAFGNFVARTVAADYPELTRAIALLAATHVWPLPPDVRDSINKSHHMALSQEVRLRHLQHAFFAPGNDPRVWLGGWDEAVMLAERAATEATPKAEWWAAGMAPVLDLIPENDVCTPPESRDCYRDEFGINRITVLTVPNAGHALLPEQPRAVAEAVISYMGSLTSRPLHH